MKHMFNLAAKFNQEIEDWKIDNVLNMSDMFKGPSSWSSNPVKNVFLQNLTKWQVSDKAVAYEKTMHSYSSMFKNSPMENKECFKSVKLRAECLSIRTTLEKCKTSTPTACP